MGLPRSTDPVLLVVASFSRHGQARQWSREQLEAAYGLVGLPSPVFVFNQTKYYETTMGPGLHKEFLVFQDLIPSDRLAEIKLRTNELEEELARSQRFAETRPLNLDPGILTLGKFMLASTKDQAHRIPLREGIFAEVTLFFCAGTFEPWPWTYADYRQPEVIAFLNEAREFYRRKIRAANRGA